MGLAERRAIDEFKNKEFKDWQSRIEKAAGFKVALEVDWEKLAQEGFTHLYKDAIPKVFFQPLENAFSKITSDSMGKDALKAGLKKVVCTNKDGAFSPNNWTFEKGSLMLDHAPFTNIDDIEQRTEKLVELLEKGL